MIKALFFFLCIFATFISTSCSRYPIHAIRMPINRSNLASEFADTKDFRKKDPILGEQLLVLYSLTKGNLNQAKSLRLDLIYNDLSFESIQYPILNSRGSQSYFLLGEKFKQKKGILTYKITIVSQNGDELSSWSQKMWFDKLKLKDRKISENEHNK